GGAPVCLTRTVSTETRATWVMTRPGAIATNSASGPVATCGVSTPRRSTSSRMRQAYDAPPHASPGAAPARAHHVVHVLDCVEAPHRHLLVQRGAAQFQHGAATEAGRGRGPEQHARRVVQLLDVGLHDEVVDDR